MSNNSEKICRLCFGVNDISGKEINDIHKEILDVLLINIDWSLTEKSTLCEDCCRKLHESFTFKSNCIDIEDYLTPLKDNGKFNLKKVYKKKNTLQKHSKAVDLICRLCIELIDDHEVTLTEIEKEKFKLYLPEIDLESTNNPETNLVICSVCYDSFQSCLSFTESCIQNERKLVDYRKKLKMRIKRPILINTFLEHMKSPNSSTRVYHLKRKRKVRSKKLDEYKCNVCSYKSNNVTYIEIHKLTHVNSPDIELLKCPMCPMQTRHKSVLRKHTNSVHSDNKYACHSCSFATKHKISLARHVAGHNAPIHECKSCDFKTKHAASLDKHVCKVKKEFKCPKCPYKTIKRKNFTNHSIQHTPLSELKMYKCDFCEYKAVQKLTVTNHMLLHKKPKKTMYKCHHCPFETFGKNGLTKHLQKHDSDSNLKIFTKEEYMKDLAKTKKCSLCDFATSEKWGLNRHIRLEHKKKAFPKKKYVCSICGYRTYQSIYLKQHMKVHLDPSQVEMFKCDECPFESKWACSLNNHKNIHRKPSEAKIFRCPWCTFQTRHRRSIKEHTEVLHNSKGKKYKCKKCSFETKWPASLQNHQVVHDAAALKCTICSFQTRYKKSLRNHLRDMHNTTKSIDTKSDEKNYHCANCTFKTNTRANILRHITHIHRKGQHKRYNCDKCSFTSIWLNSFQNHEIIHKNIEDLKLHECKYCDFKSKYERSLRNHISNRHDHEA